MSKLSEIGDYKAFVMGLSSDEALELRNLTENRLLKDRAIKRNA